VVTRAVCIVPVMLAWGAVAAVPPPAVTNPPPAPPAAAPAFERLVYQDSGGFTGRGTGKWLALSGSGRLEIRRRGGPAATRQLSDEELAAVRQAVAAVDWKTVEPLYRSRGADLLNNELSVTIDGRTYRTSADQLAKLPPGLRALFKRLDALHRQAAANKKQPDAP